MNYLFIKVDDNLEAISKKVFNIFGISNVTEGDSANVADGIYYSCSVFGTTIKLEKNSYYYEDDYNYMISVERDILATMKVSEDIVNDVASIVSRLLVSKLDNAQVALEEKDELIVLKPTGNLSDGNVSN